MNFWKKYNSMTTYESRNCWMLFLFLDSPVVCEKQGPIWHGCFGCFSTRNYIKFDKNLPLVLKFDLVTSKQVGDFFKFLCPSQKSWTLTLAIVTLARSKEQRQRPIAWYKRCDSCFSGILVKEQRQKQQVETVSAKKNLYHECLSKAWPHFWSSVQNVHWTAWRLEIFAKQMDPTSWVKNHQHLIFKDKFLFFVDSYSSKLKSYKVHVC